MIKVVLWDVDGTLLDFEKAEEAGIRGCFAHYNLGDCTDEMLEEYKVINRGYWQMMERGEIEKPVLLVKRFEDFLNAYGLDSSVAAAMNELYQILLGETAVFTPHAWETIRALKGKVLQCAVTNGTKVAQDGKLKNSKLDKEFDHIFISEVVGAEKPNVGFFEEVFRVIGQYAPEEVLIVGDSLTSDIQGGVNAGIKTCWFNPKGMENTSKLNPDYVITDVAEVLEMVKSNFMSNQKESKENKTAYMSLGMCLGISFGTAIGAAKDNLALYMCLGMSIGMGIGCLLDAKNRKIGNEEIPEEEAEKGE